MRQSVLILLAVLALVAAPTRAQSSTDPGDLFVNAYMAVAAGEKAEQAGNMKAALAKLRSAAAVLDQIATQFPSWQPNIVEYRKTRTQEAIGRVQEKIARSGGGKADASDAIPGTDQPPLPQADNDRPLNFEGSAAPLPPPSSNPPARGAAPRSRGKDTDLFAEASQRMHKLQDDLQKAKDEAAQLQNEKATLARQLDDAAKAREASEQKQLLLQKRADNAEQALLKASTEGKADSEKVRALQADVAANKRALRDMRIEADADTEYRQQLDDRFRKALEKISVLTQQRNAATEASSNVPGKIEGIQKQLVEVQKEKDDLAARLQKTETQLSKVTTQRDDALAQVAKLQEAQKQVDKLVSDNAALMAKLSDAEKSINQFKLEGEEKDRQIASLKKEVGSVKEQLAQAKKESADYQRQMGDLQAKLEEAGKQLAEAKAENAANAADKKKMVEENSILRGIVLRQQKEEAVRAKTRKVVLGELADLELHSKTLLKEIDFLSQPVVKLTDKERSLFKKPELQISEAEISIGGVQDDAPADKAPAAAAPVAPVATPSAPAAPVAIPIPAPAPAAVPEVQVKATPEPATPEPATPAKSKVSDAPKVADNTRKSDLAKGKDKSKPVEAPPLPAADNPLALSLAQTPAPPIETAPQNIGPLASAKPMTNTPSTSSDQSAPPVAPDSPATTGSADASGGGGSKTNGGTPNVPPELLPLAREGKEEFERGNYLEAEKIYRKVLAKAPNNLYTLSNLGVVLFRANKLKLAEESFKKAIAVAPEDGFSHCTLGIVFYSQGKYDEAVNELTKALAIDPKNATAHNYLGITASQKGWQEAAQKELETATSLDPNYADANFNLAVVFATQTPPNKENARKYYQRATELGAERDTALEQLIK